MTADIWFYLMVACFFTHELDAIDKHEWRIFPILEKLPEKISKPIFVWLHIPIFFGILFYTQGDVVGCVAQYISAFMIVHIGLHLFYLRHQKNEFVGASSWAVILLAGLFGTLHLWSVYI